MNVNTINESIFQIKSLLFLIYRISKLLYLIHLPILDEHPPDNLIEYTACLPISLYKSVGQDIFIILLCSFTGAFERL